MQAEIQEKTARIQEAKGLMDQVFSEISKTIVGQRYMVERLVMGLLADGHILLEGVPGLAKTTTVNALAQTLKSRFQRIQFTPDLLPADIVGTQVYSPKTGDFFIRKGPIFANIVLADEINRAPAKVQSALLEAMQERQVTIGEETFFLESPFLVLATQNPIDQEGTYPLPEAQTDRFMMKIVVGYPTPQDELEIMRRSSLSQKSEPMPVLGPEELLKIRALAASVHLDEKISQYIVDIVFASRVPKQHGLADLEPLIQFGASPRASIFLAKAARILAFLQGRAFVIPNDIKLVARDVLRHRIGISFEAEAEGVSTDDIVERILDTIKVP
ncbi:MAG: MoxR family ATPase [Candidatus Cloacimonetes bacterium]|nr:MoxR family ATPase [Candidatus Cloacimonadota bacterium]